MTWLLQRNEQELLGAYSWARKGKARACLGLQSPSNTNSMGCFSLRAQQDYQPQRQRQQDNLSRGLFAPVCTIQGMTFPKPGVDFSFSFILL